MSAPQIFFQDCSAASISLNATPRNVARDKQLRVRPVRWRTVAIFGELLSGLWILARVCIDEPVKRYDRVSACRGIPGFSERRLGTAVLRPGQRVEYVCDFMKPAALMANLREHLLERRPQPHRAITNGQQRRRPQAARLQIEQQLDPRLFRFAIAVAGRDALLLAVRLYSDDHEQALAVGILGTRLRVDATA